MTSFYGTGPADLPSARGPAPGRPPRQTSVGIDLHPEPVRRTGHGGQGVGTDGVVGGPDHPPVRLGRRHGDRADGCPGPRRRPAAPGPRSRATRAPKGGRPSSSRSARSGPASRPGSACTAAWSASWPGIRVWTSTRPPPAAGPDQPGRPGQQGQRLLPGPEPRGQQVLVDVQEGHQVGPARPGGARPRSPPPGGPRRPAPAVRGRGDLDGLDAGQGGQLLGGPGHPDPQRLEPGGVALGAHRRDGPHRTAGTAGRPPASSWATAPPHRVQRARAPHWRTGQQPDPPGAVEDAHHPPVGPVERRAQRPDQTLGEQPGAGVVAGAVDHLDHRPAPALDAPGTWSPAGPPSVRATGGQGDDQQHRAPVPSAPLDHDVHRRPGGRPLLAVGLVVGVEHHRRRPAGDRAPRPRPGSRPPRPSPVDGLAPTRRA